MLFIDTNVLLYALGPSEDAPRSTRAREILRNGNIAFSIQVFQEFYVQATHTGRIDPLTHGEVCEMIKQLAAFPVQDNTLPVFRTALQIRERFQISFWDASILAAAAELGCDAVLSEDLAHGQSYGKVKVLNPFLTDRC